MRKIIFTTLLLLAALTSHSQIYQYWNGRLYDGGPYVNDMMLDMPYIGKAYSTIQSQYITDGNLSVSSQVELSWYNYFHRLALNYYWASWIVIGFEYERKVYYAESSSSTYTEIKEAYTLGSIDVSAVSERASDVCKLSSYNYKENHYKFNDSFKIDVGRLKKGIEYKLMVAYNFKPSPYSEHDGYHYEDSETIRYVQFKNVSIFNNAAETPLLFRIEKVTDRSVINVDGKSNPFYNTGSGGRYLVYNDPAAVLSVMADTAGVPMTKSEINGSVKKIRYGYGVFLASIGAGSVPTYVDYINAQVTGCGQSTSICSRSCNGVTSASIEYLNDNQKQKQFLRERGYDVSSTCYQRRTNVLLRSLDENMTVYDENTVEDFELAQRRDFRMKRIYRLRDLANVNVYSGTPYKEGTCIKIVNSACYVDKIDITKDLKYKPFFALGYIQYGKNILDRLSTGDDVISNTLEFEIVSKASFPSLTADEKETKQICVTDSLSRDGDYIHLIGKDVTTGNYSPTLYSPEYMWEISFDGQRWESLNSLDYSKYILSRYSIKHAVVMDTKKDLLLKSTILKNRDRVMFRQKVVLKSFSSTEYSSLYNYNESGNYWYISVVSSDYYTYTPSPILGPENFTFTPASFPLEQHLCRGDELQNKKISFKLKSSNNVTTTQISKLESMADYKIYELKGDTVGKLVSNTSSYTMNWSGSTIGYRCVISWCRDSIYKDVRVIANPDEKIVLDSIQSGSVIVGADVNRQTLSLLCRQGSVPDITILDSNMKLYEYSKRVVVPFVAPDTTHTDFSSMSRTKIISFMKVNGWDYEIETGTSVDDAGITALRAWCRVKETNVNKSLVEEAKAQNKLENAWVKFEDGSTTTLDNLNSDGKTDLFYIKKCNKETKCESDSVRIDVTYFAGIENNRISFDNSVTSVGDTAFVVLGSASPEINGLEISGGYGRPSSQNEYIYAYKYILKTDGGVWKQVGDEVVVSGDETNDVSLMHGAFNIEKSCSVARVVYSRSGTDVQKQVTDTSNVLRLLAIDEISESDIVISGDGECAGTKVTVAVSNYDPSPEVKKRTRFVWSTADKDVMLVTSGEMEQYCDIYNTTASLSVEVYREDIVTMVKTPVKSISIGVSSITPSFIVETGTFSENTLSYPDEQFWFQRGTRFLLKNTTKGAESYLWTLELQYYTGIEVDGLKSYVESPVCYLYNPGQNKIRLTAKNAQGCEATVTAENIYIQNPSLKTSDRFSYFEEGGDAYFTSKNRADTYDVYPTITSGESVRVKYSDGEFQFVVTNAQGQVIQSGTANYLAELDFSSVASGLYILTVTPQGKSYKILRR